MSPVRVALTALLAFALQTTALGRSHRSLRVHNVRNATLVSQEANDVDFMNQVEDSLQPMAGDEPMTEDDGGDPEAVYEATEREEAAKAELASHVMQNVDATALNVASEADPESVYEATKRAVAKEQVAKPAAPRGKHLRKLVDNVAKVAILPVKKVAVPNVNVQKQSMRVSKETEDLKIMNQVQAAVNHNITTVSKDSAIANLDAGKFSDKAMASMWADAENAEQDVVSDAPAADASDDGSHDAGMSAEEATTLTAATEEQGGGEAETDEGAAVGGENSETTNMVSTSGDSNDEDAEDGQSHPDGNAADGVDDSDGTDGAVDDGSNDT